MWKSLLGAFDFPPSVARPLRRLDDGTKTRSAEPSREGTTGGDGGSEAGTPKGRNQMIEGKQPSKGEISEHVSHMIVTRGVGTSIYRNAGRKLGEPMFRVPQQT